MTDQEYQRITDDRDYRLPEHTLIERMQNQIDRLTDQATMDRVGIERMADEIDRLRAVNGIMEQAIRALMDAVEPVHEATHRMGQRALRAVEEARAQTTADQRSQP